ncbi:MAG: DUF814 domain-containing protein, partial [Candidatus Aegiribacteria sp.]|nr:DUF814 domain-containing protein [Candidatus Aegiribacteria sp.]
LVLSADPESPAIWWTDSGIDSEKASPVWDQHVKGAVLKNAVQPGADRVVRLSFHSQALYGYCDVDLIFEATGRNSNIVLVRKEDGRILACLRKITSAVSRYRSVVPGQMYKPPPSSGLSPGSWRSSEDLTASLKGSAVKPRDIYKLLEGVGPATARALIRESDNSGRSVLEEVLSLERALMDEEFSPWMGPDGPLPLKLGPGRPIEDPLQPLEKGERRYLKEDRLAAWKSMLRKRLGILSRRLESVREALDNLVEPETYRTWGNLLLSQQDPSRKGLDSIGLEDWNGVFHRIPLKRSRTLKSNASRFFRKASNTGKEKSNLEARKERTLDELEVIEDSLEQADNMSLQELNESIAEERKSEKEEEERKKSIPLHELSRGWRCFAGRNAGENEKVTFGIGSRNDIWLHARGRTGAHVVLKLDGRADFPPREILLEAAAVAAKGSGASSGVVPVDYTRVKYVNRMKKGKEGQVVYTREKTLFVDLDRLT